MQEIIGFDSLTRRPLRLKHFEYSQPEAYFVTVCSKDKCDYFGNIIDGEMTSFSISRIVLNIWKEIPGKFQNVKLDAFVIMPNHFHGILVFYPCRDLVCQTHRSIKDGLSSHVLMRRDKRILMKDSREILAKAVRYFKARSARIIHEHGVTNFRWQCNYYGHAVRSPGELRAIREYIVNNPLRWRMDRENRLSKNFMLDLDKYFEEIIKQRFEPLEVEEGFDSSNP